MLKFTYKRIKVVMITYYCRAITTLLLFIYLFINTAISQPIFKVVDQNNQPLANAVIEIVPTNQATIKPTKPAIYIMDQANKLFVPSVLVIPKNSLVSFPNSDDIRHHVYSFSSAKPFELRLYAGKPKNPLTFEQSGVVVLGCNIHDSMVGYIYVAEHEHAYLSDEKGLITLPDTIDNIDQLQVWHSLATTGVEQRQPYKYNQLPIDNGIITFTIEVYEPTPRDSFENLITHDH